MERAFLFLGACLSYTDDKEQEHSLKKKSRGGNKEWQERLY